MEVTLKEVVDSIGLEQTNKYLSTDNEMRFEHFEYYDPLMKSKDGKHPTEKEKSYATEEWHLKDGCFTRIIEIDGNFYGLYGGNLSYSGFGTSHSLVATPIEHCFLGIELVIPEGQDDITKEVAIDEIKRISEL